LKRILILFIIVNLTYGCLYIPLPAYHGQEIDKVNSQVAVGVTTRGDVISILGQPDVTRDRFIFYKHKMSNGGWFVMVFAPSGGAKIAGEVFMDLYFEFDSYGVLTDYRVDKYDEFLETVE